MKLLDDVAGYPPGFVARYLLAAIEQGERAAIPAFWALRHNAVRGDGYSQAVINEARAQVFHDIVNGRHPFIHKNSLPQRSLAIGVEPVSSIGIGLVLLGIWLYGILSAADWSPETEWDRLRDLSNDALNDDPDAITEIETILSKAAAGDDFAIMQRAMLAYMSEHTRTDIHGRIAVPDLGWAVDTVMKAEAGAEEIASGVVTSEEKINAARAIAEAYARRDVAIAEGRYSDDGFGNRVPADSSRARMIDTAREFLKEIADEITRDNADDNPPPPPRHGDGAPNTSPDYLGRQEQTAWEDICARMRDGDVGALLTMWELVNAAFRRDAPSFYPDEGTDWKERKAKRILRRLADIGCIPGKKGDAPVTSEDVTLILVAAKTAKELYDIVTKGGTPKPPPQSKDPGKKPPPRDKEPGKLPDNREETKEPPKEGDKQCGGKCDCDCLSRVKFVCTPIVETKDYGRISTRRDRAHGDVHVGADRRNRAFGKWRKGARK